MNIVGAVTCGYGADFAQVIDRNYYPVAAWHRVAQRGATDQGSDVIQ